MSTRPKARHIAVVTAIAAGNHLRSDIQRHCKITQNAALTSLARLVELELVEVEEGAFRENQRRRYTLAIPLQRAVEALEPAKEPEWTDALSKAWEAPVAIPRGSVSVTHVVGW